MTTTKKLQELAELSAPSYDAQMYVLDSVSGTPADRRANIGYLFGSDFISGLVLEWVSANSIKINPGLAVLPNGQVIRVTSAITLSSMSLTANTWYHLYLYLSGSTPTVEYSTTSPTAPYLGMARTKTGATTRRYIGSVRAKATNTLANFFQSDSIVFRRENYSVLRVLNSGSAIVETTISVSALVPTTSRMAILRVNNSATNGVLCTGTSDDSVTAPGTNGITLTGVSSTTVTPHSLNSSQAITYWYNTTPTGTYFGYIDIFGYYMER